MSTPPRSPLPPAAIQDEEPQTEAFTPLTDSHGRELYTHGLSYAPALPEYPKAGHDGFTYIIPVPPENRGSEKDALKIIEHVCTIFFYPFGRYTVMS
jgi:hypothetical protein